MAYVFINKVEPKRIKMIEAISIDRAIVKLAERLEREFSAKRLERGDSTKKRKKEYSAETVKDYKFGYLI